LADLGRELAVKVLLDQHRKRPEFVRRFIGGNAEEGGGILDQGGRLTLKNDTLRNSSDLASRPQLRKVG